jgi:hypothetical protein
VLCLEVHHNGRRLARAGVRRGVLSGMLTWVSRKGHKSPDGLSAKAVVPGLECRVGGLNTARARHEEHVDWVVLRKLRLGDEILLRVTRSSRPDKPCRREPSVVQKGRRGGVEVIRCSFCGRDRPRRRANGGPGVMVGAGAVVCAQCAAVAQLIHDMGSSGALHLSVGQQLTCGFCAKPRSEVLVTASGAGICPTCVKTATEAL